MRQAHAKRVQRLAGELSKLRLALGALNRSENFNAVPIGETFLRSWWCQHGLR